jgi:hypothetical protein
VLEAVMCGKKVIVSAPVYEGLPDNFKKKVILCENSEDIIKKISEIG